MPQDTLFLQPAHMQLIDERVCIWWLWGTTFWPRSIPEVCAVFIYSFFRIALVLLAYWEFCSPNLRISYGNIRIDFIDLTCSFQEIFI